MFLIYCRLIFYNKTCPPIHQPFPIYPHSEHVGGRKISFEKSAMTVSLKLGGGVGGSGGAEVAKLEEAFISNVPVSADTPSLLDSNASPRLGAPTHPHLPPLTPLIPPSLVPIM